VKNAELHPQLLADSHLLGRMPSGHLLLSRNSSLHWFILVPETDREDVLDLPPALLQQVMADCQSVSQVLKQHLGYPKVNFAGLGNVVPQMHLHIIGRREGDACWPQPVWGNLPATADWSPESVAELTQMLTHECGLRMADTTSQQPR
jgi:diadenosine tetraphosphate (Ap4A) HIT family hydrolase